MKCLSAVTVTLFASCALPALAVTCNVSATGVALGSYTPNQPSPADSAGSISIACNIGPLTTLPSTVSYSLNISRGTSSGFSPREMSSGTHKLNYNLYRDPSRLLIWGDATGGTVDVNGTMLLTSPLGTASITHAVYGRIFGGQNAVPGAYADAIVVTVSY